MTRNQTGVMWGWILFEIISGFYFTNESWQFKTAYFILTATPVFIYITLSMILQLAEKVSELERRLNDLSAK